MKTNVNVNVNCTLVQVLKFCTGRTAHNGSRGIALLFHDHGTRRGWGVSVTPRPLFTPGKDPLPIVQEAEWASWPVWTSAKNLAPPPGFDPRTVQLVTSRYTDHATRPTLNTDMWIILIWILTKFDKRAWIWLIWIRIRIIGGLILIWQLASRFHRMRRISWPAERLFDIWRRAVPCGLGYWVS
jgi:hypothetical protein